MPSSTGALPSWRTSDLLLTVITLIALQSTQIALAIAGWVPVGSPALSQAFIFFPTGLTAVFVLALAGRRGIPLPELGFRRPPSWRAALYVWAAAVFIGPLYAVLLHALGVGLDDGSGVAATMAMGAAPGIAIWGFSSIVFAPVVEEIIFRALLFRGLRARMPLYAALPVAGFLFAAFHFDFALLIPLAIVGLAFAYAYERTGSLWCSILPHAGLNAVAFAALFVALQR